MEILKEEIDQKIRELNEEYKNGTNFNLIPGHSENSMANYNEARNFIYWYNQNLKAKQRKHKPVYKLYEEEQMELYNKIPDDYFIDRTKEIYEHKRKYDPEADQKARRRRISVWLYKYVDLKMQYNVLINELKSYTDKAAQISQSIYNLSEINDQNDLNTIRYNPNKWNEVIENSDSIIKYLNDLVEQMKYKLERMVQAVNTVENEKQRHVLYARYIRGLSDKQIREEFDLSEPSLRNRMEQAMKSIRVDDEDIKDIKDPVNYIRHSNLKPGDKRFYDLMNRLKRNDKYLDELKKLYELYEIKDKAVINEKQ